MHYKLLQSSLLQVLSGSAIMTVFVFGVGGCASLPKTDKLSSVKSPLQYQTSLLLSGTSNNWPTQDWWMEYGDEQLNKLVNQALTNSPDLAIASARLRRAEAFRKVSDSTTMPQLSASASATEQKMSYNYLTPKEMTPQGWKDYGQATINLSWEIDFWGKNRAALAAATSELDAAHAEQAQAKISIVTAIVSNYAYLAELYKVRKTIIEGVAVRKNISKLFLKRYENGLETKAAVSEAKAKEASSDAELLSIEEQIALQKNTLAAIIGVGPDSGLSIQEPNIKLAENTELPSELALNLLGRRPDIVASKLIVEANSHKIEQKKAEFYPNVNLSAFIGVQSLGLNNLAKSGSDIGGVGPAISIPIFTAGRLQAELRSSEASYDEAVANYDKTLTNALTEVSSAAISQRALAKQIAKAKEVEKASNDAYRINNNRYKNGVGNYIQVLYAEEILLASRRNLATLEARAFALDVALKKALGGGYKNSKNRS